MCDFCEGKGWYWSGRYDDIYKQECICEIERMEEAEVAAAREGQIAYGV